MKKVFVMLFASCITAFSCLTAEIFEIARFSEVLEYVADDTLVVLDIDDTLLVPQQTLGTDVWFRYRMQKLQDEGLFSQEAFKKTLSEWLAIRYVTKVKLVEAGTEQIIEALQKQKNPIMGLTSQEMGLAICTRDHLASLNINLEKTAPHVDDLYFKNGPKKMLYHNGILFASGASKGEAFALFLDAANIHPKHLVFVDDSQKHLKDVQAAVESRKIAFVGLRYGYSDKRVQGFRGDIADLQHAHSTFGVILSDEDAEALLKPK